MSSKRLRDEWKPSDRKVGFFTKRTLKTPLPEEEKLDTRSMFSDLQYGFSPVPGSKVPARFPQPSPFQGPYLPGGKKQLRIKTMKTKKRGGMNLRASTLEKRAKVEAKIKEKEELAAKRRMTAMQKKNEKSSATPEELEMIAAKAVGEANRLQAEAEYLAEAARRARDTPRELDELTALLQRMEVGGRRTRRQKGRRTRRRV
jgi:hypothetical protein